MKNKEYLQQLSQTVAKHSSEQINFYAERLAKDSNKTVEQQSLALSILSIFGGALASLSFVGFLLMAGLYKSEISLAVFGILLIITAILISLYSSRILYDTISTSFYIIGFCCLLFAIDNLTIDVNIALPVFIIIAACSIFIARSYILIFLSTLVILACILALFYHNIANFNPYLFIALLALLVCLLFFREAKLLLISIHTSTTYYPLRSATVFAFLLTPFSNIFFDSPSASVSYITWGSSLSIILLIAYLIYKTTATLEIANKNYRLLIASFSILPLAPTLLYLPIAAALLIILLSFRANYRTGFALGLIAFIYSISRYYYDLSYSLLTKSILLISSGLVFLLIYMLIYKKLTNHEKI